MYIDIAITGSSQKHTFTSEGIISHEYKFVWKEFLNIYNLFDFN